uniref:Conserved hypothetical plastid protein n=1 Tax=Caulacanthus okamurae TaxID=152008 RepID=A0A6H1UAM0_9FLOR|nr:conserved hypothetical plastid protein [Caulacanthus okamurae]QIZ74719.1 conserved hypothetical plastid protein [Caulacanthus okamurae]
MQRIIINMYFKPSNIIIQMKNKLYKLINLLVFFQLITYLIAFKPYLILETTNYRNLAFNGNIIHFQLQRKTKTSIQELNYLLIQRILTKCDRKNFLRANKIVDFLQSSGFLNKVEYFVVHTYKISYFIINININSIIKKIEINKHNQLQIPRKFLATIFEDQLGLPANYRNIDKSINKIYEWYIKRGFKWVHVQIIQPISSNTIHIKIFEGKLTESKFIHVGKNNIKYGVSKKIKTLLVQKLGLVPGSSLNIQQIENGIEFLKKIQLIDDCTYKITHHQDMFKITVKYSIFTDNYGYFYNKTILIPYYKKLLIALNKYQHYNIVQKTLNYINKIIYLVSFKNLLLYKNLNFKFFVSSLKYDYYYTGIKIDLIKKIPHFYFSLFRINNQWMKTIGNYIKLNFSNKLSVYYLLNPSYNIQKHTCITKKILDSKKELKTSNISIFSKYYLQKEIECGKNIVYMHNLYNKRFININKYVSKSNHYSLISMSRTIHKTIKQNLLSLKIQLKYSNFNVTEKIKSGYLLILESIFYMPIIIKTKNNTGFNFSLIQYCKIKYNQTFRLPILLSSRLIFFSEINLPIINHKYNHQIRNLFFNNFRYSGSFSLSHFNTLEYHIPINLCLSYYLFYNFIQTPYYIYKNHYYIHNIGSGVQLNMPVKIIPNIRFEHRINNYEQQYYQFRLLSLYNN